MADRPEVLPVPWRSLLVGLQHSRLPADRRLPDLPRGAGERGDTTRRATERFERDVLAKNPRPIVIQFGINDATTDVWKMPPEAEPRVPKAEYRKNLTALLQSCRQKGINVVLMTPNSLRWSERRLELYGRPAYNWDDPEGLNLNLRPYTEEMRALEAATGTPLVDVMRAHDEAVRAGAPELLSDGVHPNEQGHRVVAEPLMNLLRSRPELLAPGKPEPSAAGKRR